MKMLSILLTLVVLIAVAASCTTPVADESVQYDLTISSSGGGSVTTPGEDTFAYEDGAVVDLVATPDAGYRFMHWTGDVDTIADVEAASTTITLDGDYSITASFVAQYVLTIDSTEGGEVTAPGEGTFTYDAGTVIEMVAEGDEGYRFLRWTGDVGPIADTSAASTSITMNWNYAITASFKEEEFPLSFTSMVTAGAAHTVGLKSDGTVIAVGANDYGQCNVGDWTDIVQVSAHFHTVGLRSDGTAVAVGDNEYGQCDVDAWADIVEISAGHGFTVGLKFDGTVVAVGWNKHGQCNVNAWTDVIQISAGQDHTVGLKADGTVVSAGGNSSGERNVSDWTGIVEVSARHTHTVGLKSDGTVVATGLNSYGQCSVDDWIDIVQVSTGHWHTVGLRSDGTAVATGNNLRGQCNVGNWTDLIQVCANGHSHSVGLKSDGTVVAVGSNSAGQCNVLGWLLD